MLCPYCKEEVQAGAVKCKHCGSMLSEQQKGDKMQKASLSIQRPSAWMGKFNKLKIIMDNKEIISIAAGKKETVTINAGEHEITVKAPVLTRRIDPIKLMVKEGETVNFTCGYVFSWWRLILAGLLTPIILFFYKWVYIKRVE